MSERQLHESIRATEVAEVGFAVPLPYSSSQAISSTTP